MKPFRLAWLNLSRRKVPTVIAVCSIAISIGFSGVLLRLYRLSGSRFSTLAHAGDAVVGAKAGGIDILLDSLNLEGRYPSFIPLQLYRSLKAGQGVKFQDGASADPRFVEAIIPFVYFAKFQDYRVIGTDSTFLARPDPTDVPQFAEGKWVVTPDDVVIGDAVARRARIDLGQTLVVHPWTGDDKRDETAAPVSLNVVGILKPTGTAWDQALFSSLESAHRVFESNPLGERSIWGADVLNYYLVYLRPDGMPKLEALVNGRTVAEVISVDREKARLEELTGTGRNLGILMCALILLLGGLTVAAMMVTRFDAMAVQLAVLRALGYTRREITRWLLAEGAMLGIVACFVGALIDFLLLPIVRLMLGQALPPLVSIPLVASWPVWVAACFATIIAVFVPLARLYRQDVHQALKGT